MSLDRRWREFVCNPRRPGRYLSNIGSKSAAAEAMDIESDVLRAFLEKLANGEADADLLADAVDLSHLAYSDFCRLHLRSLLDSLANERVGEEAVVGPALRGNPRWDRTAVARRSARIPATHFVSRLPERSFALPENALVRWLVGSLARGVDSLERRVRSRALPPRLAAMRDNCQEALAHQWFRQVLPPPLPTQAMFSAARRHRAPGYRMAAALAGRRAARETGGRKARWLRTLDLLRANWLIPENVDDLFELYALTLVLDVLQKELRLGEPSEYGLAVPGRDHVAAFKPEDGNPVLVFFDQSPEAKLGAGSRYRAVVEAHEGAPKGVRRPDVMIVRSVSGVGRIAALVEVKRTRDRGYISDSIYKALGYVQDFKSLWDVGPACPKVALLVQEDVAPLPGARFDELDVVVASSFDRSTLARFLSARLGLPCSPVHDHDVGKM